MSLWRKWSRSLIAACAKVLRALALFLVAIYRSTFSGLIGGVCRFQPTCSKYAEEAFTNHSPTVAFYLTLKRLLKCHPLGPFGYDPVPSKAPATGGTIRE